ncbi:hypothetical protein [Umezawaea sp. Da 62-37]|uniref:hypothetical protein n=1 Tax=Umezawaea sp. Da 62-37 TaxID=3075927 RepID=UPI0028F70AFF|nr:hypothetical protein [Umezawaea sp. Da 62-37]WNV86182.1 hypothetical protein RM788_50080 [Umezawaea sp. Da 62-37]
MAREAWMRRAALYAASGGFLTVAFSVLGAHDATAAPAVKPPVAVPKAVKAATKPVATAKRVVKPKVAAKVAAKPVAKKVTKPKPAAKTKPKPKAAPVAKAAIAAVAIGKPKPAPAKPAPAKVSQPLKRAESNAQRQAKTDQQYQAKKKTAADLRKTAPARTAYTESQRGGPPGTAAKKTTTTAKPKAAATTPKAPKAKPLPQPLRQAEADAQRQAKTDQQYQAKTQKTRELQKTAPARTSYTESQRGGPPGTAQRKQAEKTTQDLKQTASARAAYAESQRGGAPGSGLTRQIATAKEKADKLGAAKDSGPKGSARAFEATQKLAADAKSEVVRLEGQKQANGQRQEKARETKRQEQARAAQAQVDYNDSQAGRPVGERTGLVVETVAPAVSRVTNPKTGEVSLNNFRIGKDAPSQEQLIPLLSEKAKSDAKACPTGECDAARSKYLGWKTAENVADLCTHSAVECSDDFELRVAATVSNSGIQPVDADDAQRQLIAQGLAAPIPSLKGPPTGPLPKGSPPPPPVPEPRSAAPQVGSAAPQMGVPAVPRPQAPPGAGAKTEGPATKGNTAPPQGPPPAAGPNQGRQQPDRPNGNVVEGERLRAQLAGQQIAGGHAYAKHVVKQGEFRGLHTRSDLAGIVETTMLKGEARTLTNGRSAYWYKGVMVIRDPKSADGGSIYPPTLGKQYFLDLK